MPAQQVSLNGAELIIRFLERAHGVDRVAGIPGGAFAAALRSTGGFTDSSLRAGAP